MFDHQSRKYDRSEITKIFEKKSQRRDFISEYEYWLIDDHHDLYVKFIDEFIVAINVDKQEDAIEVSIRADIFKNEYLSQIEAIIYSKKGYWIKLASLDWLWHFSNKIDKGKFTTLNSVFLHERNPHELNKIQALLNLLKIDINEDLLDDLFGCLQAAKISASFYRALIYYHEIPYNNISKSEIKSKLQLIIDQSMTLSTAQKRELINELK